VADRYERLCLRLAARELVKPARPFGRQRTGAAGRRAAEERTARPPVADPAGGSAQGAVR